MLPGRTVVRIEAESAGFHLRTDKDVVAARKLVIACGLGITPLAASLGMDVPVRPVRGQMLITERLPAFMPIPSSGVRQITEGGVQIGTTMEDGLDEPATTVPDMARMAARAATVIPALASTRIVRAWAGVRPMTPDGCPVYAQSPHLPGAFAGVCHSGVTLCAVHATVLAKAILGGSLPDETCDLQPERFHAQAA